MGWDPNSLHKFAIFLSFTLLFLKFDTIRAQDIVPFPTGTTLNQPLTGNIADEQVYQLTMSGATTTNDNETICTGFTLPSSPTEFWIIQFEGVASTSVVHHMTLYGCASVPANACGCKMGDRSPLFSWVRNTPKVRFTGSGTDMAYAGGFRIGGSSDKQFIFLEIHYCHAQTNNDRSGITIHTTTTEGSLIDLAIFPIMGLGTIPANTASFKMDTCVSSFPYPAGSFFYVGFQAHSHNLGRLISAYVVNDAQVRFEIGQGNPLWPEAYIEIRQPTDDIRQISSFPGDLIYTRCIYSSAGVSNPTNTNGRPKTDWQEMCIFNLLVASTGQFATKNAFMKGDCTSSALLDGQASSTSLIPSIPALDIAAAYGNITSGNYQYRSKYTIKMGGETFNNFFLEA